MPGVHYAYVYHAQVRQPADSWLSPSVIRGTGLGRANEEDGNGATLPMWGGFSFFRVLPSSSGARLEVVLRALGCLSGVFCLVELAAACDVHTCLVQVRMRGGGEGSEGVTGVLLALLCQRCVLDVGGFVRFRTVNPVSPFLVSLPFL
ncbi:hypothetical protein, unlikely [Trypanosoma brucei gambiense DAL972]|uniref:Uncharacterized protein n=1 Tax=Trypanosoma brucei gambiense (strain MHOM/CI/86/DAL972) TaxID=679716 RepID=C9ZQN2_TRYB9|nr:hypothetical protein, unlikely [Trypanosoma brucei gambiense DAL972]CBH11712.1 hypothetical protein, unlikely [Trypanosoma brucei gambiense DAL972]|eukprot:XP_011773997.1 hypothetical protein, unlikely [Trypanosoma brucei gambiense DAL972]